MTRRSKLQNLCARHNEHDALYLSCERRANPHSSMRREIGSLASRVLFVCVLWRLTISLREICILSIEQINLAR